MSPVWSQPSLRTFVLAASFHVPEPGESYQVAMAAPVPPPESDQPWAPLITGPIAAELELREFAPEPWLDDGAAVYVCGSLHGMATGVEEALVEIIGSARVEVLIDEGRYRRDVY